MAIDRRTKDIALGTVEGLAAFGFGSGLVPKAPGTAGSLVAMLIALILVQLPLAASAAVIVAAFILGVWLCERMGRLLGEHDHGGIVWDEFVGMWLVLVFIPLHWAWWLAGFVLFRLFDIFKPWPIGWLERRVQGGLGVMLDDVAAGLLALGVLHLAGWLTAL